MRAACNNDKIEAIIILRAFYFEDTKEKMSLRDAKKQVEYMAAHTNWTGYLNRYNDRPVVHNEFKLHVI